MHQRADAVGWVHIGVPVDIELRAPLRLADGFRAKLHAVAVIMHTVVKQYCAQVMLVAAFQMYHFTEQVLALHVQHRHYIASVAYVFQRHVWHFGFFVHLYNIPMVIQRDACYHLAAYILTGTHGINGHWFMELPGRGNDHGVYILP